MKICNGCKKSFQDDIFIVESKVYVNCENCREKNKNKGGLTLLFNLYKFSM
jgi:hypothetical protein